MFMRQSVESRARMHVMDRPGRPFVMLMRRVEKLVRSSAMTDTRISADACARGTTSDDSTLPSTASETRAFTCCGMARMRMDVAVKGTAIVCTPSSSVRTPAPTTDSEASDASGQVVSELIGKAMHATHHSTEQRC